MWCDFVVFLGSQLPEYLSLQNCDTSTGETFPLRAAAPPLGRPFPSELKHLQAVMKRASVDHSASSAPGLTPQWFTSVSSRELSQCKCHAFESPGGELNSFLFLTTRLSCVLLQ